MCSDESSQPTSLVTIEDLEQTAKAAQEVGKIGPLSLLLSPSFKLLGDYWAKKLENYLTPKENENLIEHVGAVADRVPHSDPVRMKPTTVAAMMEWADEAKRIDPESKPAQSEAWRQALVDIVNENYELLKSLPLLDEISVRHITDGGTIDYHELMELRDNGFMEIVIDRHIPTPISTALSLTCSPEMSGVLS